ncbi:LUD domain-containing protein [Hippea jasoniae]|uniref:LUD domain-containing protein n=1 Tax=Hippea jasoniae TaxID=944479 RepID=UPI000ABE19FC|nr:LUD domain-containing protein [Hippea jasoniae]
MNSVEQFKENAKLNGVDILSKKELEKFGYSDENYFKKDDIAVVKALAGCADDGSVIVDASQKKWLETVVDVKDLYVLINKNSIKPNKFEAYKPFQDRKYLIFLAAESKTADIEKNLVSGVHGAEKLYYIIIDDER